jgi:hypothetical protein
VRQLPPLERHTCPLARSPPPPPSPHRQIAEAIFITDKTASVHVSNILRKLGAANRVEATALAHRAGFALDPSEAA